MIERGTYVRMRCGVVGVFLWSYENPVHRPGYHDRASVGVGVETWGANLSTLDIVELGPVQLFDAISIVPMYTASGEVMNTWMHSHLYPHRVI